MRIKPLGWLVMLLVLVLCVVAAWFASLQGILPAGLLPALATGTQVAAANAAANTAVPAANTRVPTRAAPSATPAPSAAPTQAPTQANRQTLTVALDSFGSYFTAIQVNQMKNRDYDLVLVPFGLGGNDFTEDQRAQMLTGGQWDILFNTANAFARKGNIGKIVTIIDQSAGADKIVAWPQSVTLPVAQPIGKFNDLKGMTIAYSDGSVGQFQMLALLRVVGLSPQDVVLLPQASVGDAVSAFKDKKADAVAGWEPDINSAIDAGGQELVSSSWWRNISDVMIVSNAADKDKKAAVQAFLRDWYLALKAQQENLDQSAADIAAWQYAGQPTNDWSFVSQAAATDDLKAWLGTIAQAGLPANVIMMTNKDLIVQQLVDARAVWSWGGIDMNAQFDPNAAVAGDYVLALSKDPALKSAGQFVNNTFQPVAPEIPQADPQVLISLPAFAELPCKQFEYEPNSPVLKPESMPVLQSCAQAAIELLRVSDAQILVSGWSAWPKGDTEDSIREFARLRAIGIQTALVQMGVDPARIAIVAQVPPLEDQNTSDETRLAPYRKVVIEIKRQGGR